MERPRQWGGCWLCGELWQQLNWTISGGSGWGCREGTDWLDVLKTLVSYRLIDPGSEWRLHREWYERSAMADLLGGEHRMLQLLYRCQDKLLAHKTALFSFLKERWQTLFQAEFEVLLYDLTSTYFECDPPEAGKRRFGYSRDKRSDCVQVIIALVVTPEGLPLAYEVMAGNTREKTTLQGFLEKIEPQYGGRAHLGHGPRHPDRGGSGRDAGGGDTDALPCRHAAWAAQPNGAGLPDQAMGAGA